MPPNAADVPAEGCWRKVDEEEEEAEAEDCSVPGTVATPPTGERNWLPGLEATERGTTGERTLSLWLLLPTTTMGDLSFATPGQSMPPTTPGPALVES
jgi:hypothetical protein